MKKALLTFFLGACALVAGAQSVASNVAGEYTGDIWIGLGAPVDTTNQDTRLPDQHVTITPARPKAPSTSPSLTSSSAVRPSAISN